MTGCLCVTVLMTTDNSKLLWGLWSLQWLTIKEISMWILITYSVPYIWTDAGFPLFLWHYFPGLSQDIFSHYTKKLAFHNKWYKYKTQYNTQPICIYSQGSGGMNNPIYCRITSPFPRHLTLFSHFPFVFCWKCVQSFFRFSRMH